MRQYRGDLSSWGTNVVVVSFEQQQIAAAYVEETNFPWPVLLDPDRVLYRAYSLERGGAWRVLGIDSWWTYIKLIIRGRRVKRPTDDIYQLGGNVLIGPDGTIRFYHASRNPADRPRVEDILNVIRSPA